MSLYLHFFIVSPGDLVLLFNSRYKWSETLKVIEVFQYGAIEMENEKGERFKANGQIIKECLGVPKEAKIVEGCKLDEKLAKM